MNKLKKGLTYISERTDQLRYSDKYQDEKWLQPLSEYIPLEKIMRGQPVSIATAEDIAAIETKLGITSGTLKTDSNTYIVLTNPVRHTHAVGLAYEYSEGLKIPSEELSEITMPDPIHVLGQGKFDIDLDYLVKSHQIKDVSEVENIKEYVPEFLNNYEENIGKPIWVKGDKPGELTIIKEEAYQGYRNIIQVGFISDAWLLSQNKNENQASIEVQIDGDNRGALDSTQFEGILGEDVVIPENDPIRVFALGQEEDVAFEGRINITPSTIRDVDTTTAFIGIQKMDGKTAVIRFGEDFDLTLVKNSGVTEDVAFINTAGLYNDAIGGTIEIIDARYFNDAVPGSRPLSACINDTQKSIAEALKKAVKYVSGYELSTKAMPIFEEAVAGYVEFKADEPGGYYYMYISENMYNHLCDSIVYHNGSSYNKERVVLADCRITERQNLIGVYYSGKYNRVLKKDSKCIFLKQGLFIHNTDQYQAIGEAYYLFQNGRVTKYQYPGADTINKVFTVQDKNKLIVNCGDARLRVDMGNLPIGYMKPAIGKGGNWYTEFGFLLMDGTTRYSCKDYEKLFVRLQAWYPIEMLNVGILEGETEKHFIIPRCTTRTSSDSNNVMQIKFADNGVYEMETDNPYIREFGKFEKVTKYTKIDKNLEGVAYPKIGKYHKAVRDPDTQEIIETDVDTSIDISSICNLCLKEEKIAPPNIDQLDVHLYVDPDPSSNADGLIHWVEIRNGFHNYNNVTTYGFEWKIEKIEGKSKDNAFGKYLLSTDIKDGMGIYYQSTGNQPLKPLSGMPYKVVISKRSRVLKQLDLSGVVSAYISNSVLDHTGKPTTKIAATGSAVIDAIENRPRVKLLQAYPKSEGVDAQILLGKETEPADRVEIASVKQLPIYGGKGIKFETSLKDGLKEDCKLYLIDNRLVYQKGSNESGNPVDIPSFVDMPENALVTKKQVKEHSDFDATTVTLENAPSKVHGMVFGLGGNIDASLMDGLRIATHNSKRVGTNNSGSLQNDQSHESYIPYTYYGNNPLDSNDDQNYIFSKEGYTINQAISFGEGSNGYYSVENYENTNKNSINHIETINGIYKNFSDIKRKFVTENNGFISYETVYNFIPQNSSKPTNFKDETSYDIEFKKLNEVSNQSSYASIKAAGIYAASLAEYKNIYGESINNYKNNTVEYETKYTADKDNTFDLTDETSEYIGSALQAVYEMPLAFFNYKSEPDWYKKYLGIIVDRVNDIRDNLTEEDNRSIFTEEERNWTLTTEDGDEIIPKHNFNESDNTFHYTEDELKSLRTYLNSITDTSESSQNILTSVGILLKAAKETQERLLKVETSTFGADADTIPGDRKRITFPNTPDVNPEATHLGLNRLVRAMSRELYGTANPADDQLDESNNTSSTLSKVDELEVSIDGATFDKNIQTDSSDNLLTEVDSGTYPYTVADTFKGGHTDYTDGTKKVYSEIIDGKYISAISGNEETVTEESDIFRKYKSEDTYISNKEFYGLSKDEQLERFNNKTYIEETIKVDANWDPISGRLPHEGETEDASVHGTWTKIDLEKEQDFNVVDDEFETNTETNLVPASYGRDKFNGVIDAIARICTKVNALTYTVNGVDNIDSTPRRLNTIRQNIETLIKEAYFDGTPETTVVPATESEIAKATTEDKEISKAYSDEDIDKPQPSTPYTEKLGKKYTGLSRFDQLSNDLYNYVLNCKDNTELFFSLNSNNLGEDISENEHKAIQYTSEDDVNNKGASKKQVLLGRTFNGKKLLIDGVTDSTGANVNDFNSTHVDDYFAKSAHINIPDSIEEYQYASIIDILIDAIGEAHFRKQINNTRGVSNQELRPTKTLTERITKIELALDNVVRKLNQKNSFENDTIKENNHISNESDTIVYSIEDYLESISKWFGLSVPDSNLENDSWGTSASAEQAAGYGTEGNEGNSYLTNANPVINANFIIKQLLFRLRNNEATLDKLSSILGQDFDHDNDNIIQNITSDKDGTQHFDTTAKYNLTDDVADLLLTIYGKDLDNYSVLKKQTEFEHRTSVDSPEYLAAYAWEGNTNVLFTKVESPTTGDEAYRDAAFTQLFGKITSTTKGTITIAEINYARCHEKDATEAGNNSITRFTGNDDSRNIIDDIIKELYFVPSQVTKDNTVNSKADSIDVDYENNFYNLDSGINKYDYEKRADDGYGRIGKAIGYGNRQTLFGDYLNTTKSSATYRRSRLQVLEDQVRHLRSILGLNKNNEGKSVFSPTTAYGGQFELDGLYTLGNYNFNSQATRNGNMYIEGPEAATSEIGAKTNTNIFTVLFNLENAIRDIGRELGTETKYHGDKYDNFEQLNKDREDKNTIYDRLAAVEDITDKLFGVMNTHSERNDESEDDTDGILDIQWIEE